MDSKDKLKYWCCLFLPLWKMSYEEQKLKLQESLERRREAEYDEEVK